MLGCTPMRTMKGQLERKSVLYADISQWLRSEDCLWKLQAFSSAMVATLKSGGKLFFCGNGGSFADACHVSAELTGRFRISRQPLPSIVLGSNCSSLSAIANDFGYARSFSRELAALAQDKDLLIALSTSGSSANIVHCLETAMQIGMKSILLTSSRAGIVLETPDCTTVSVPFRDTDIVQEVHMCLLHLVCESLEAMLE